MDRSKTSILLLVCSSRCCHRGVATSCRRTNTTGVTFEAIPTGDYKVDPGHSVIGFSIRH